MPSSSLSLRNELQGVQRKRAKQRDCPGVICGGPWIVMAAVALGYVLDKFLWIGAVGSVPRTIRVVAGLAALICGVVYFWRAHVMFRRKGTAFLPWKSATALAVQGIYAHTRNPMYQGAVLLGIAGAIALRSDWTFMLLIPACFLIHYGVVLREERYLERKFGEAYRQYLSHTPRYGLCFCVPWGRREDLPTCDRPADFTQ
jgi:protein-S-isoprenylcysteine O-methyltransferase Ste14